MNITEGIYADFNKVEKGLKIYMKLSKPIAYATLKLIQFMARSIKENIFDKDMCIENREKYNQIGRALYKKLEEIQPNNRQLDRGFFYKPSIYKHK